MERRPFSNETIQNLDNIKKNPDGNNKNINKNKNIFSKKQIMSKNFDNFIVLPNVNSKLIVSRTITSKSPSIKKRYIEKISSNNNYNKSKNEIYMKNNNQDNIDLLQMNETKSGTESIHTNGTIQKKK